MDSRRRTARLLVLLGAAGLWLGLTLVARDLLTRAVVLPLAQLLQAIEIVPQHVLWGGAVLAGTVAGFVVLGRTAPPEPPLPQAPPPASARKRLADVIRAADTSLAARRELAERLARIAAGLRAPSGDLPSLDSPRGFRTRFERALDALERFAEGRRR